MPHAEDLVDPLMGGTGGKPLFDSLAAALMTGPAEREVNQQLAREFGLSAEEYARVLTIMGRTPVADRTWRVQRHVVGTLQLQIVARSG